jgi:hypothetical protein
MTEPLVVPNRTIIQGQSPEESSISFVLTEPMLRAEPWTAAVVVGSKVELSEFSISLSVMGAASTNHTSTSRCKRWRWRDEGPVGLLMPGDACEFRAFGLHVTTHGNASNAIRIEGAGFAVQDCVLWQHGCVMSEGFEPSATILMSNARDGLVSKNRVLWSCSAFDLDTSERVIFEENHLELNVSGVIPHGNSVSGYGACAGGGWPLNRWWAFLRNNFTRPACAPDASGQCGGTNWEQRETWTTVSAAAAVVISVRVQIST